MLSDTSYSNFCETSTINIIITTYFPLPIEGMAIDLIFFSSARVKTFFVAFSNNCCELDGPQLGLFTWMTNFAGKLCPGQMAAEIRQLSK